MRPAVSRSAAKANPNTRGRRWRPQPAAGSSKRGGTAAFEVPEEDTSLLHGRRRRKRTTLGAALAARREQAMWRAPTAGTTHALWPRRATADAGDWA